MLSVWVRTLGAQDDRVVASDPKRPIRSAFWSPDGSRVLYPQDAGGDENFHLFAADPNGGTEPVDLTPYDGTRVEVQSIDYTRPDTILIAMNRRDPRVFDVHRLDPITGSESLDTQNPGTIAAFAEDAEMVVRAGMIQHADASAEIVVRDSASAPWRTLVRFGRRGRNARSGRIHARRRGAARGHQRRRERRPARALRRRERSAHRRRGRSAVRRHERALLTEDEGTHRRCDRARAYRMDGARPRIRARLRGARRAGPGRPRHLVDRSRRPYVARFLARRCRLGVVLDVRPQDAAGGEAVRRAPGARALHARADDAA